MNMRKLKSSLVLKDISTDELLELLHDKGVNMTKATWYRRLRGDSEFTRAEISALSEILQLEEQEIIDIFFNY